MTSSSQRRRLRGGFHDEVGRVSQDARPHPIPLVKCRQCGEGLARLEVTGERSAPTVWLVIRANVDQEAEGTIALTSKPKKGHPVTRVRLDPPTERMRCPRCSTVTLIDVGLLQGLASVG